MCKFLVQQNQEAQQKPELLNTMQHQVQTLEKQNKTLEENIVKNLLQRKNSGVKSQKIDDLLVKFKKLDEVCCNLAEKNKANEVLIKKQNKIIDELKLKTQKTANEMNSKIKELENELYEKNQEISQIKQMFAYSKITDLDVETIDLDQSISSESFITTKKEQRPSITAKNTLKLKIQQLDIEKDVDLFKLEEKSDVGFSFFKESEKHQITEKHEESHAVNDFGEIIFNFLGFVF